MASAKLGIGQSCSTCMAQTRLRLLRRQQQTIAKVQQEVRNAREPHEHLVNHVRALEERIAEQQALLQAARETSDQLARCCLMKLCTQQCLP